MSPQRQISIHIIVPVHANTHFLKAAVHSPTATTMITMTLTTVPNDRAMMDKMKEMRTFEARSSRSGPSIACITVNTFQNSRWVSYYTHAHSQLGTKGHVHSAYPETLCYHTYTRHIAIVQTHTRRQSRQRLTIMARITAGTEQHSVIGDIKPQKMATMALSTSALLALTFLVS